MIRSVFFPVAIPLALVFSIFFFILLIIIFWVWMLVDCIKSKLNESDKILWILIIIFFNVFGALLYLFLVKSNKKYRGLKLKTNKLRRLYRSKKDRILGGVCGGIGNYLNVDPTLIRLLWILFMFMGGSGIIAYIIAWIIIPEEK